MLVKQAGDNCYCEVASVLHNVHNVRYLTPMTRLCNVPGDPGSDG